MRWILVKKSYKFFADVLVGKKMPNHLIGLLIVLIKFINKLSVFNCWKIQ